jgi:prolyl oligopeptidase
MRYPPAQRLDLVEHLHGTPVADPYRWLEETSEETTAWCDGQDALWAEHRSRLGARDAVRQRLGELTIGVIGAPVARRDRQFFVRREIDDQFAKLIVRDADGTERVLIDPAALSEDLTTTLDMWSPSDEGDRLAYQLSEGGNEESSLYVMDVDTQQDIEGPIDRVRAGGLSWVPGGESYYFVRRLHPSLVPDDEEDLHRRVYLHTVGSDPDSDVEIFGAGRDKISFYSINVSLDGRWVLIAATTGGGRNDLYITDRTGDGEIRVVQEGVDASTSGGVDDDGLLYLFTKVDAPKWRIVVTDPTTPTSEHWRELIPETDDPMTGAALLDDAIAVVRQRDVVSYITVHDRTTGEERYAIDLPGLGSASVAARPEGGHELWIGYTDLFTPFEVWHHDVRTRTTELWARPPGAEPAEGLTAQQVFYTSKDGTRIPMFIIHRADAVLDGTNPTILYGYGGFNIAVTPTYSSSQRLWVERGGVYAIANIRGGSEYGEEWHRAGMLGNKQNVFDDFIAGAEWLIANDWTNPSKLAIQGGSNGGLLVGAVLTQRPDLFEAVHCGAPVLDSIRKQFFTTGGRVNINEYGDIQIKEQFEWLHAYSPYHSVREGTDYPAVLFTQGEADARVHPMHSRKMCAALQWATTSDRPILLRREHKVGHAGRSLDRGLDQTADVLTWLGERLDLDLRADVAQAAQV